MNIRVHDEAGGVRVFQLDRPPANALTFEVLLELKQIVAEAAGDPGVGAILVRGNERFFCAGLDLHELAGDGAEKLARLGRDDGLYALWTLPKPTIAEVSGHAIAGGALLALACDFRITRRGEQRIGLNENSFGIAFPREALEIARYALPQGGVARLILEGETFPPEQAKSLGYVQEVVASEALGLHCLVLARKLAEYPPAGYAHNKRYLQGPSLARCRAETDEARTALAKLWNSAETRRNVLVRAAAIGRRGRS